MYTQRTIVSVTALLVVLLALVLGGCGKGRGTDTRTIEITFIADDELNWDGEYAKNLDVGVCVLRSAETFNVGDVVEILDPGEDNGFGAEMTPDIVGAEVFRIEPGVKLNDGLTYKLDYTDDPKKLQLGVICDYFDPAEDGHVRQVIRLKGKKRERITIVLGKDRLESVKK